MKKVFSLLIAAVLLLTLCVPSALAAGGRHCGRARANRVLCGRVCPSYGACQNGWVDENGDGICDNCHTAQCGDPANQNRPCRNWGTVNADASTTTVNCQTAQNCPNDGVCAFCGENCGGSCTGSGNWGGNGCGARQGGHHGGHHGGHGRHCA